MLGTAYERGGGLISFPLLSYPYHDSFAGMTVLQSLTRLTVLWNHNLLHLN